MTKSRLVLFDYMLLMVILLTAILLIVIILVFDLPMNSIFLLGLTYFGLVFFNYAVRRSTWFKPYFISRYNVLCAKFRHTQEFDFSKEILFEKLLEVLPSAGLEIMQSDLRTGTIFAISDTTWSWGENIYITLIERNGKTTLDFCSAIVFGVYSWDRNKDNYKKMLQEFEESLII